MDFKFNIIQTDGVDKIQIIVNKNNIKILRSEYKKENITELELFSLAHLTMFSYQHKINDITFHSQDNQMVRNVIKSLEGVFSKKIKLNKTIQPIDVKPYNSFKLNTKELSDEIKHISQKNIVDISCFYYVNLKRYIFNIDVINEGKLIKNEILNSENTSLSEGLVIKELSDKIDSLSLSENYEFFIKKDRKDTKSRGLVNKILRPLVSYRNHKITEVNDNTVGRKKISYLTVRSDLLSVRDSINDKMKQKENLTLFTDGSVKNGFSSSAFIIKHNNEVVKSTNLIQNNDNTIPHEEIALLKGIEKMIERDVTGEIYIVSDQEDNYKIINALKNNTETEIPSMLQKLFHKVKYDFQKIKNLNINFLPIKSHTRMEGYEFDGNREVDEDASKVIEAESILKDKTMFSKDIIDNKFISIDIDKEYELYKKANNNTDSKYGQILNKKNISLSHRKIRLSNSLLILTKKHNDTNYCLLTYDGMSHKIKNLFFSYKNISEYKKVLDNFILNIPNKNFDNLRIFSNNEVLNKANKDLVLFECVKSKDKLKQIIDKSQVSINEFKEHDDFINVFKHYSLDNRMNKIFNLKVLGIESNIKKATPVIIEKQIVKPIINIIEPFSLPEGEYIGNKDLVPLSNELDIRRDYLFIDKKEKELILNFHSDGNKTNKKIDYNDNYLLAINDFLIEQPNFKKSKNLSFMISVPEKNIVDDISLAIKGEGFFNCNIIKILHRKFRDPKLLVVQNSDLEANTNGLKWYKENINESPKNIKEPKIKKSRIKI